MSLEVDNPPENPLDPFTNAVACLIYSMTERGITGNDPWWGQDFLHVKRLLEEKGINMDPNKEVMP